MAEDAAFRSDYVVDTLVPQGSVVYNGPFMPALRRRLAVPQSPDFGTSPRPAEKTGDNCKNAQSDERGGQRESTLVASTGPKEYYGKDDSGSECDGTRDHHVVWRGQPGRRVKKSRPFPDTLRTSGRKHAETPIPPCWQSLSDQNSPGFGPLRLGTDDRQHLPSNDDDDKGNSDGP